MAKRTDHTALIPSADVLRESIIELEAQLAKLRILLKLAEELESVDVECEEKKAKARTINRHTAQS